MNIYINRKLEGKCKFTTSVRKLLYDVIDAFLLRVFFEKNKKWNTKIKQSHWLCVTKLRTCCEAVFTTLTKLTWIPTRFLTTNFINAIQARKNILHKRPHEHHSKLRNFLSLVVRLVVTTRLTCKSWTAQT